MRDEIKSIAIGLAGGIGAGLIGIGGGIIMIPCMISFLGVSQHKAHATSLAAIAPLAVISAAVYSSYGNGYRLTGDPAYKKILLNTADTLATLFNPKVGTILSWPREMETNNWPHNTIIDNMINLELLFWASKNGGDKKLYDIAVSHADKTMENQFRPDYSNFHVALYDTITGKFIKGITHQGYNDKSMWARGQAWSIYGFTVCYRETHDIKYLNFVQKVADIYLKRLPEDYVQN